MIQTFTSKDGVTFTTLWDTWLYVGHCYMESGKCEKLLFANHCTLLLLVFHTTQHPNFLSYGLNIMEGKCIFHSIKTWEVTAKVISMTRYWLRYLKIYFAVDGPLDFLYLKSYKEAITVSAFMPYIGIYKRPNRKDYSLLTGRWHWSWKGALHWAGAGLARLDG